MDFGVFTLCATLTLTVTLTVSVKLDPPKPFGTKTIYDWSFTAEEMAERNLNDLPAPEACRPLYIGAFLRHGTRNPSDGDVEEVAVLMDRIGGHINAPAYSHLNNYIFPFTIEEESQLVTVGYQEHVGLGRRFASRVRQLLGGASESELRLIASTRNRTIDSAKGFREGLAAILGKFDDKSIVINNTLTRYYDNCERYIVEVDDDPETAEEEEKFAKGPEMLILTSMFSEKLQLNVSDLTPEELYSIFAITAQEEGILGASNWTDIWYNTDELDVLDYYEDFEAYWERGCAYPITYEMSCVVLEEMFKEMDAAKSANEGNSSSHPKGTFMFGHSSSVIPLECLLAFNDSTLPILADNYDQQANRSFRASRIDPMAANLAFVLYECDEGSTTGSPPDGVDWPPTLGRYMVQLLLKEMSIEIPNTCGYDLCPYDEVRSHFEEYIDRCNFDERCAVDDGDDNDDNNGNDDDDGNDNDTNDNTAIPSNRCDEPCTEDEDDDNDNKATDNTATPISNTPIVLVTIATILSMFTATCNYEV